MKAICNFKGFLLQMVGACALVGCHYWGYNCNFLGDMGGIGGMPSCHDLVRSNKRVCLESMLAEFPHSQARYLIQQGSCGGSLYQGTQIWMAWY